LAHCGAMNLKIRARSVRAICGRILKFGGSMSLVGRMYRSWGGMTSRPTVIPFCAPYCQQNLLIPHGYVLHPICPQPYFDVHGLRGIWFDQDLCATFNREGIQQIL